MIKISLQTIMMMIKIMTNRLMMMKKIIGQCRSREAEEIIGKIQCVLGVIVYVCLREGRNFFECCSSWLDLTLNYSDVVRLCNNVGIWEGIDTAIPTFWLYMSLPVIAFFFC